MTEEKQFQLPNLDHQLGVVDCWQDRGKGPRPQFFPFPSDLATTLVCEECGDKFFVTERYSDNYHYNEIICQGCGRTMFISMGNEAKTI